MFYNIILSFPLCNGQRCIFIPLVVCNVKVAFVVYVFNSDSACSFLFFAWLIAASLKIFQNLLECFLVRVHVVNLISLNRVVFYRNGCVWRIVNLHAVVFGNCNVLCPYNSLRTILFGLKYSTRRNTAKSSSSIPVT